MLLIINLFLIIYFFKVYSNYLLIFLVFDILFSKLFVYFSSGNKFVDIEFLSYFNYPFNIHRISSNKISFISDISNLCLLFFNLEFINFIDFFEEPYFGFIDIFLLFT